MQLTSEVMRMLFVACNILSDVVTLDIAELVIAAIVIPERE